MEENKWSCKINLDTSQNLSRKIWKIAALVIRLEKKRIERIVIKLVRKKERKNDANNIKIGYILFDEGELYIVIISSYS